MLQNAYLLAKIGADTAENERNFAENLPKFAAARRMSLELRERRAGDEYGPSSQGQPGPRSESSEFRRAGKLSRARSRGCIEADVCK